MLDKAQQRLQRLPAEAQRRVTLVQADGENADEAVDGRRFAAVLCHGVLGYLERPEPLVNQLCRCAAAGGVVSIMTGKRQGDGGAPGLGTAVGRRPWRRLTPGPRSGCWECRAEPTRWRNSASSCGAGAWSQCAGTGYGYSSTGSSSVEPSWTPSDSKQVAATAAVELEASRRDPYRQLSRVFHLIGRRTETEAG